MTEASVYALLILSVFVVLSQDVSGQDRWNGSDKTIIKSEDIINLIREGKDVYCGQDSVIIGDVLFDNIANKSIESNINISSDIYGEVRACKKFKGLVNFSDATFHRDAIFENSVFSGAVLLDSASFKGILNLDGVHFNNISSFEEVNCEENVNFNHAIFYRSTSFSDSIFSKLADFSQCIFKDHSEFVHANFRGRALFRGSTFGKETSFRGGEFARDAEFNGADFKSDAVFTSAKCEGTMNFNKHNFIKFIGTEFNGNIYFNESQINQVNIKYAQLSNHSILFLDNCDFYRLDARWADIKDHILFDEQIYIKLINYYKSVGMFADADACYREYNHMSTKPNVSSKIISSILWITCDYGTDARRAPILLVILALIFAALYRISSSIVDKKSSPFQQTSSNLGDSTGQHVAPKISIRDALYFSAMVLVNSSTNYEPIGGWRWAVLVERMIGWALLAIFIITIVRLGLR